MISQKIFLPWILFLLLFAPLSASGGEMTVTDCLGRSVTLPASPEHIIGSGSGALRLLTYLQALDKVTAVDSAESRTSAIQARPYSMANPWFKELPIFGEFRGMDNPELIAGLSPQPQVIFKVSPLAGPHPDQLTAKTGIPVVGLEYGNLTEKRENLYATLRLMGKILDREKRAEEVVVFFENHLADIAKRTADIPEDRRPSCYIGGVSFRGSHGFTSTEPGYAPFAWAGAKNIAAGLATGKSENIHISKEKLLEWDPEIIFIDMNTVTAGEQANALHQLKTDPALAALSAVKKGSLLGVLPYNSYTINYGSVLANCYFVGKTLYPDRFADVDPVKMADEIYTFLVGKPVFSQINEAFSGMIFSKIALEEK